VAYAFPIEVKMLMTKKAARAKKRVKTPCNISCKEFVCHCGTTALGAKCSEVLKSFVTP